MQIWGHRGAYSERPENTLHAFARAVELGADGVELDVHLSKDGEAVVIHDERIDRTSDGVGWVGEYTLQELKKFNFNKRQISEPKFMEIPTLREVLELLKPHKDITINIEIKNNIVGYYLIEEKTLNLVKEFGMLERVLFSSFNHFTMLIIKHLEPNAKTALLCGGAITITAGQCLAIGASALNLDAKAMRGFGVVDEAVALGVDVNVWGISSAEDLQHAKNAGVNAVIVNNIANTKEALQNTRETVRKNDILRDGILCWYPFDKNTEYTIIYDPEKIPKSKPNGKLLLIFDNPCGIKKICREPFNIKNSLGKEQVKEMLEHAGFKKQKWYYPVGDYQAALEIYSDNFMPNEFFGSKPFHGLSMSEVRLLQNTVKIGVFERMNSSYLVEASASEENCDVDYVKITLYRKADKRLATAVSTNTVKKIALHPDAKLRLKEICANHRILNELDIAAVPVSLEADGNSVSMPRHAEPVLLDYWLEKIKEGKLDEDEMLSQFDYIRDSIFKVFEKTKKCFWELVPANAFYNEASKQITFFDQEFSSENLDPNVAVVRAIHAIKYQPLLSEWDKTGSMYEKLQERCGVKENFEELLNLAKERTGYVFG